MTITNRKSAATCWNCKSIPVVSYEQRSEDYGVCYVICERCQTKGGTTSIDSGHVERAIAMWNKDERRPKKGENPCISIIIDVYPTHITLNTRTFGTPFTAALKAFASAQEALAKEMEEAEGCPFHQRLKSAG